MWQQPWQVPDRATNPRRQDTSSHHAEKVLIPIFLRAVQMPDVPSHQDLGQKVEECQ